MKKELLKKMLLFLFVISFGYSAFAQVSIKGIVKEKKTQEPLPGVSVVVKGTTSGTSTGIDGDFQFPSVKSDAILVFSFIGYKTIEVPVNGKTNLNVFLEEDAESLDEVIVIGYGVQKKRNVTGSISKVRSDEITSKIAPSFESALQGQAAGVAVTTGSGMAGSGSVVRVRGTASVGAGGDPLYVVDGIPITQDVFGLGGRNGGMNVNPLSTINPDDIESIEVLKDAAATGIYGSRGANGVILINTKNAKGKGLKFNFSTKQSISTPSKKVDMLNSKEFLSLYQEAWENDGNVGRPELPGNMTWEQAQKNNTDWWDEVTRVGHKQQYNLSANIGTDKLKAYLGGSYSKDNTYMINNSFERISGRANIEYKFLKNLKLSLKSSISRGVNDLIEKPWEGGLGSAMAEALPIYPIKNDDGTYFKGGGEKGNPVMVSELKDIKSTEVRTINNLSLNYSPIKNLFIDLSGSLDYLDYRFDGFVPKAMKSDDNAKNNAWSNQKWVMNYNYRAMVSYLLNLKEEHEFNFLAGHEFQNSKTTGKDYSAEGDDITKTLNEYSSSKHKDFNPKSIDIQEWSFISYLARVNYAFKKKYLAQVSFRVDGSSRFGSNNRYGYFPTGSLGWIISDESFMENLDFISFLKIKSSYGITGNANIGNYAWRGTYKDKSTENPYNGKPITYPARVENPDLKWETTNSFDAAIETRLFNDRIALEVAYYNKLSSDVLVEAQVPNHTGYSTQWKNMLKIKNEGFEFDLTTRNFVGDFKWTTKFNLATLNNEVTDIGDLSGEIGGGTNDTRIIEGYPLGVNYLVRVSRIDPADGRPIYLNKDGYETKEYRFEGENNDRVPVGKVIPDFTGGITNTFSYKGFDLSFMFTFSYGASIFDSSAKRQMGIAKDWNWRADIANRWKKPGDNAKYPRLTLKPETYGGANEWFNTDMWLYDASYIKLKNLTIGYNLPKSILKKIKLSSARISFTGTNLLTFTDYPGADPEVARDFDNAADRNMSPNISWLTPPQERVYTVGLNVSF